MEPWPRPFSRAGGLRLRLTPLHLHMDWNFLRRSAAIALALMALCAADARAQALKITFLGTGAPIPALNRFGPSIPIAAGGQKILFDAGRRELQRQTQANVRWPDEAGVFQHHLKSEARRVGKQGVN